MEKRQADLDKYASANIYEEISLNQIINPNNLNMASSFSSTMNNLQNGPSIKSLSNYVSSYAYKERKNMMKQQSRYFKNVVKSVHSGLIKYAKNSKFVGNLVGEPKAQRQWRLLGKTIGVSKFNNEEVRIDCKYNVPLAIKLGNLHEAEAQMESRYKKELDKSKQSRRTQPLINKMHNLLEKIAKRMSHERQATVHNTSQNVIAHSLSPSFILYSTTPASTNQTSPCLSPHKKPEYRRRKYRYTETKLSESRSKTEQRSRLNETYCLQGMKSGKQNNKIAKTGIKRRNILNGTLPN